MYAVPVAIATLNVLVFVEGTVDVTTFVEGGIERNDEQKGVAACKSRIFTITSTALHSADGNGAGIDMATLTNTEAMKRKRIFENQAEAIEMVENCAKKWVKR